MHPIYGGWHHWWQKWRYRKHKVRFGNAIHFHTLVFPDKIKSFQTILKASRQHGKLTGHMESLQDNIFVCVLFDNCHKAIFPWGPVNDMQ